MDASILNEILSAIHAVHNPYPSEIQRKAGQEYCEGILRRDDGPMYGIHLADIRSGYEDTVRHFGLQILEHSAKFKWNSFSITDRDAYKQAIIGLIQTVKIDKNLKYMGTGDFKTEKVFIKEKICRIIVEMAKRDWPQRWLDFLDYILGMLSLNDPKQIEYALMIIRTLGEDIFIYLDGSMEDQRRLDLMNALTASFSILVPALCSCLSSSITMMNSSNLLTVGELLSIRALEALSTLADRFPLSFCSATGLLPMLTTLLSDHKSLALHACDCLLVLVSRRAKLEERDELLPLFSQLQIFYSVFVNVDSIDGYALQKRLTNTLTQLGLYHLPIRRTIETAYISQYLDLMLFVSRHPSLLITSLTVPLWTHLFRQSVFLKDVESQRIFPYILELCRDKLIKLPGPEDTSDGEEEENKNVNAAILGKYDSNDQRPKLKIADVITEIETKTAGLVNLNDSQGKGSNLSSPQPFQSTCKYISIDWDTNDEFSRFFSMYRNQMVELIRLLANHQPLTIACFVRNNFISLLNSRMDLSGWMFDARVSLLDAAFRVDYDQEQVRCAYRDILVALLQFQVVGDFDVYSHLLSALSILFPVLAWYSECTSPVLEYLLRLLTFQSQEKAKIALEIGLDFCCSPEILVVRHQACLSLVRLASTHVEILAPYFSTILNWIQQIFNQNALFDGEKTLLIDFVTSTSRSLSRNEQTAFVSTILSPLLLEWESNEFRNGLQTPEAFRDFLGIGFLETIAGNIPSSQWNTLSLTDEQKEYMRGKIKQRKKVFYVLNTMLLVVKRMNDHPEVKAYLEDIHSNITCAAQLSIVDFFKRMLPNLFLLLRSWHLLWDSNASYSSSFLNTFLSLQLQMDRSQKIASEATLEGQIYLLCSIFPLYRESGYYLLDQGSMFGKEFYGYQHLILSLKMSIVDHLQLVNMRHLKSFITVFLKSFLQRCPRQFFSVLQPLLIEILHFILKKLNDDWALISNSLLQAPTEASDMEEEMGQEENANDEINVGRALRDLTRSFFDMLYQIFNPIHETSLEGSKREADFGKMKILIEFLLDENTVAEPILLLLGNAFWWRDSLSCRRSINISMRILPLLLGKPNYFTILGREWMTFAIRGLHDAYHQEAQLDLVGVMTAIYSKLRPLTSLPKEVFLSLSGMTEQKINEFEETLFMEKVPKKQRILMRTFLKEIMGVNISQWYKSRESHILNLPEKLFIKQAQRRQRQLPLSESEHGDLPLISDLFQDS